MSETGNGFALGATIGSIASLLFCMVLIISDALKRDKKDEQLESKIDSLQSVISTMDTDTVQTVIYKTKKHK